MLEQFVLFIGCSSIQFFNSFYFVTYRTPCSTRGHHSHLIFCDLQDTMPPQISLLSSLTTFVTYRTPCQARGHHFHFPPNQYLGMQMISLGVINILKISSTNIFSLLATSLINNSRLIFIYVKITNVLLVVKKFPNQQFKAVKSITHPNQQLT